MPVRADRFFQVFTSRFSLLHLSRRKICSDSPRYFADRLPTPLTAPVRRLRRLQFHDRIGAGVERGFNQRTLLLQTRTPCRHLCTIGPAG
jgi:hypothetical protein